MTTDQPLPGINGVDHFTPCDSCKLMLQFTGKLCDTCQDNFRRFHQLGPYRSAPR